MYCLKRFKLFRIRAILPAIVIHLAGAAAWGDSTQVQCLRVVYDGLSRSVSEQAKASRDDRWKSGYVLTGVPQPKVVRDYPLLPSLVQFPRGPGRIEALVHYFQRLATTTGWTPAAGEHELFGVGFVPKNPKSLQGKYITGFTENGGGTEFSGHVIYVFEDAKRPGNYNAIIADAHGQRKTVPISGVRALLYSNSSTGSAIPIAEKVRFSGSRTNIALDSDHHHQGMANALPRHAHGDGVVQVVRTQDGTLLVPAGVLNIDGEKVSAPASAYLPPAPRMAEVEGLAALEAEGYHLIGPLGEGGTRHVYVVEKGGVEYAAKILDPDKFVPDGWKEYEGSEAHGGDWRFHPQMTPELMLRLQHESEEIAAKLYNREQAMIPDLPKRGFNPVVPIKNARLAFRGITVGRKVGKMSLGRALKKYPSLKRDKVVLDRELGLLRYDKSYRSVNQDYYGIPLGYEMSDGKLEPLGIDMKPDAKEPWDNTLVDVEDVPRSLVGGRVIPAHVRITEAWDVDE